MTLRQLPPDWILRSVEEVKQFPGFPADAVFRSGYVRIAKAQSKGRLNTKTKTAKVRDVLLNARALHALHVLKTLTILRGDQVLLSPRTGLPYTTEKSFRLIFSKCLKRLGIRHRPAYNTRHTYATMLLMAGANPHFVAAQLGHSVTMTLTVYSRWLRSDADRAELAKLRRQEPNRPPNAPFVWHCWREAYPANPPPLRS